MIAGRPPFKGEYESAVLYSIAHESPEPVTALRSGVPLELERIINKCLAKDPARAISDGGGFFGGSAPPETGNFRGRGAEIRGRARDGRGRRFARGNRPAPGGRRAAQSDVARRAKRRARSRRRGDSRRRCSRCSTSAACAIVSPGGGVRASRDASNRSRSCRSQTPTAIPIRIT